MDLREELLKCFTEALEIKGEVDTRTLMYREYPTWTSLAHMALVAIIETDLEITLETDDILAMSTFDKALDIVKKYRPDS